MKIEPKLSGYCFLFGRNKKLKKLTTNNWLKMDENDKSVPKKAVIDASFALGLLLPNEKRKKMAKEILLAYQKGKLLLFAPALLKFEVTNGLRTAAKRKRISQFMSQKLLETFLKLKINYQETNFSETLRVALKFDLSVCDASYLSLSRKLRVPLLTLDSQLAN